MRTAIALGLVLGLGACEGSGIPRLDPLGLFGSSREVRTATSPAAPPGVAARRDDDRGLVDQVTALSVTPMPGGAVVEARGLPATQGYWDVGLVPLNGGRPAGGVLLYELRVAPPPTPPRVGTPVSREVVTAAFVSDAALRDVVAIRVLGSRSAREARR